MSRFLKDTTCGTCPRFQLNDEKTGSGKCTVDNFSVRSHHVHKCPKHPNNKDVYG